MEVILDSELPICDAHHHFWDLPSSRYMVEELAADIQRGHKIVKTVCIEVSSKQSGYYVDGPEAFRPVGETEFIVASEPGEIVAGIVGFADLRSPEISDVLAAHIDAGKGRFRGIRNNGAWDSNPEIGPDNNSYKNIPYNLFGDPAFRRGFAALGQAGLSFDTWVYHPQMIEVEDLARAFPDIQIVLDHLGGPIGVGRYRGEREAVLRIWRLGIQRVASCPNVAIKLGGIGMPIFGMNWHERPGDVSSEEIAATWRKEIRWCIEQFGVDRCMFESNFPPDRKSCSYEVLWNAFKRMVDDASQEEKTALSHDTATRIYRLN